MNFYKIHKIPKLVRREVQNFERRNPTHTLVKNPYDRVANLDVIQLHARNHAKKEGLQWQGGDREDRHFFVEKKKMEIADNLKRALALSSKRVTHQAQSVHDMPFLEFTSYYRPLAEQHLFQPHEMQWSVEEYDKQGFYMNDLGNARLKKMFAERT